MELVLLVAPEIAGEIAGGAPESERSAGLRRCLQALDAHAHAMHPGVDDPELARYFTVEARADARLEDLAAELARCPGVEAAYVKPAGEAPAFG